MESTVKQMLDIHEFMVKLGLEQNGPPMQLPPMLERLRIELLKEEVREYIIATEQGSLEDQFDALIDLVYVALGTAYLHGFPFAKGWDEVHAANMRKERGVTKRGLTHDAMKPPGWKPPDLASILQEAENAIARGFEETTADEFNNEGAHDTGYN